MSSSRLAVTVTGATSGIGRACARRFAKLGMVNMVITGRRTERLLKLQKELESQNDVKVVPLTMDVCNKKQVFQEFQNLPDEFQPRFLINNAGLALGTVPANEQPLQDMMTMVETNCSGLLYVTKAVIDGIIERATKDKPGHIVNIGSVAGNYSYPGGTVYCATKAFVEKISMGLRADLVGRNVRVTNLEPGLVETEFSVVRMAGDKSQADNVYAGTDPMSGDDIAELCHFVTSLPPRVNINRMEIMAECQAPGPFQIIRDL